VLRQHGAKHSRHFEHAAALLQARCAAALVRAKIQPAAKVLVPWAREALLSREGDKYEKHQFGMKNNQIIKVRPYTIDPVSCFLPTHLQGTMLPNIVGLCRH
jgi:hypothetical protein